MATKKKKAPAKKAPAKKAPAKKAPAKKTAAKKTAAKKTATKKTAGKKTAAKKTAAKKTAAKKTAAKKTATKKAAAKKTAGKKTAAKKTAAGAKKKASAKPSTSTPSLRTVVQHVFMPAPPGEIYRLLTDPKAHGAFTGTVCDGEPVEGGAYTAGSGYMRGRYETLEEPRLIVCTWQTTEWPKGYGPSRLEFVLEPGDDDGCELTMTHAELPASQADDYRKGWIDFYWTPMREFLARERA